MTSRLINITQSLIIEPITTRFSKNRKKKKRFVQKSHKTDRGRHMWEVASFVASLVLSRIYPPLKTNEQRKFRSKPEPI